MEEPNTKLTVNAEDGTKVEIDVIDIIESEEFKKEYIVYTIGDDEETVYASVLNEKEETYSLDTIESQEELDFINKEIDKIVSMPIEE